MKVRIIPNHKLFEKFKNDYAEKVPQEVIDRIAKEIHKRYP
ncbi:hypothetical protein Q7A53_05045 [Halobacillus rhizosphaerae]